MKYLITGGCGFLGSNLARAVLERGEALAVLDDLSRLGSERNLGWLRGAGAFRFRRADVRDAAAVEAAVAEEAPDVVFHLAGQVAMTRSLADPRRDFEVNALGTLNVLEALRKRRPQAVVLYSSTNKVYGCLEGLEYREEATRYVAVGREGGFDESLPLDFQSPYGCSKGAADQYMLDYHRQYGLRTVVFRHSSIYGGRQFATIDQGWVGWFCAQAAAIARGGAGGPFDIFGDGKQVRDVLHADDLVACYLAAAARAPAGRCYNIGGGARNSYSLLELFAHLEGRLGIRMAYRANPPRPGDQKVFVADCARAEREFGWSPRVPKEEGVDRMYAWVAGEGGR